MKMKIKRVLSAVVAMTILLGMGFNVYAEEKDNMVNCQAPDYYTEEYQREIRELQERVNIEVGKSGVLRSGYTKNLPVPIYQQVGHSNCGAASGRMVLKYKTGVDHGENTLANAMEIPQYGSAYVYRVTNVLNSYLGVNSYKYVTTHQINFGSGLFYSINADKPVICHVKAGILPNYNGASNPGHYVVAKGYSQNSQGLEGASTVTYHDPHYDNRFFGTYTADVNLMQQAIRNNADYYIMAN